ncbi:MAG: acyltransferase domain-containing protein [Neisseriaceae bacterium]|nr:acyltransferase domain-containing protein [Neisseriaceae bacterium]
MDISEQEAMMAIVGVDGLFPKTADLSQFWTHLANGEALSTSLSREDLLKAGVAEALIDHPDYVPSVMMLDDVAAFDADFFGVSPQMAKVFDPQNRKILESVWHAIENAGYAPSRLGRDQTVGVFAGKDFSEYLLEKLMPDYLADRTNLPKLLEAFTQNGQDFLANWVAYKLGFSGPVLNIQTACSTGLSALAVACQNLQLKACDVAVVAASRLAISATGYLYQAGLMHAQDGVCRPLDERASGIVVGSAVVSVVLKRFTDAVADQDPIWGVIRGVGVNNDGHQKQDFMAPGIKGQSEAIKSAFRHSGLTPADIDYVELHGTGTRLGDPVEITALKSIYGQARPHPCVLGSVKANIGHTSSCAGLAGLIKILLSFKHEAIPPLAHFERLNAHIGLNEAQFAINKVTLPWPRRPDRVRRAGLSSFGFGGTNVHVLLEEPPRQALPSLNAATGPQLVFASAQSEAQLATLTQQIHADLIQNPSQMAAVAYTSLVGRKHFDVRATCVIESPTALPKALFSQPQNIHDDPKCGLVFTGQGGQITQQIGRQLYDAYPVFRQAIDECRHILGHELAEQIWPQRPDAWDLSRPAVLQPAIFMCQYAQSKLWQALGMPISCVLGHSIGEIAAACFAGALTVTEALTLARLRGAAFEQSPSGLGGMLVVFAPARDLPELPEGLVVAAKNAPGVQVIAGLKTDLGPYEQQCHSRGLAVTRLNVTHAFHSPLLAPVAAALKQQLLSLGWAPTGTLQVAMYSTLTGQRLQVAPDVDYWVRHLLSPTLFDEALCAAIGDEAFNLAVEVGPVSSLAALLQAQPIVVATAPKPSQSEQVQFLQALALLYQHGCVPDATVLSAPQARVPFSGYPFKKTRHWLAPNEAAAQTTAAAVPLNAPNVPDAVPMGEAMTQTDVLNAVCTCWQTYLGRACVDAEDDFFLMGGTSLAAIQIQAALTQSLNVPIDMLEFMTSRTPRHLSHLLWAKLEDVEKHA